MVKVIVGMMGSSVASGSSKMSTSDQLQPFFAMLHNHQVRELDTARVYNAGKSEELLGALPDVRAKFSVATKAPGFVPGSLTYDNILTAASASLAALQQDRMDLYYFHGPDRTTPLEDSCRAIHELHTQGRIGAFGLSNFRADEVTAIDALCVERGWLRPSVYQGGFNPLARAAETALFPTLRERGMAFYAYSPLAGGFFARPVAELRAPPSGGRMDQMKHFNNMYVNETSLRLHDELSAVCARAGVTLQAATLRWLCHHSALGDQDGVVLGGSNLEQMEANLQACEAGPLPESVVRAFEDLWPQFSGAGYATAYCV